MKAATTLGLLLLVVIGTPLFGQAQIVGFGETGTGWTFNGYNTAFGVVESGPFPVVENDVLTLTDVNSNWNARSAFLNIPQKITRFAASFVYQNLTGLGQGAGPGAEFYNPADGVVFTLQNQGLTAIAAAPGSSLGYEGISPAAGLAINIYGGHVLGIGYAPQSMQDQAYAYSSTSPVDFLSLHPIRFNLAYDGTVLTVILTDTVTQAFFSTAYAVDLVHDAGGSAAFVGFTAATGAGASDQRISEFTFSSDPTTISPVPNVTIQKNAATGPLAFDATPGLGVAVAAVSDNLALVPIQNVTLQNFEGGHFAVTVTPAVDQVGTAKITLTAQAATGGSATTSFNVSVVNGPCSDNVSWVAACPMDLASVGANVFTAGIDQSLNELNESRWYKFPVQPDSRTIVTLTSLPANYDLFLFKDIQQTYNEIVAPTSQDLVRLTAEFAPVAFSPTAFSDDAFAPTAFSPTAFSPTAFSPTAFSPTAFSPTAFSPTAFSPTAFSPTAFSPTAFSPTAFSPTAFSPTAFSPTAFSPTAFSGAQTRSLIGISAFPGTAGEGISLNTWDNSGDFYICVRGRNGAFDPTAAFHLQVTLLGGACQDVLPVPPPSLSASAGNYRTIIVTDFSRLAVSAADKDLLQGRLLALAQRPEVQGVVVDVALDAAVTFANAQADAHRSCVFAKNLVAGAINAIIARYREANPLEYVVLVGNDDVIPFFRYPDTAGLGSEKNYIPPVLDNSASQASLRAGFVLSQDGYGTACGLTINGSLFPIADLAVGRLVERPEEIAGLLDSYLAMPAGQLPTPNSSLVTGYDFLADAAAAVGAELRAGIGTSAGQVHDQLIASPELSPQADPNSTGNWTAVDLRSKLLGARHDMVFLAGHFSAVSALAADWVTELGSTEVAASPLDLSGAIVFGAGCHVGYNINDNDGVPHVTREPDWAQAFALKRVGAFIGGTGYQYGDTQFIEYDERLYLEFARQLRAGSGPVSIGKALTAAKKKYLIDTPLPRGTYQKAVQEVTLFGLPMVQVNLPEGRGNQPGSDSSVSSLSSYATDPGATLGLQQTDLSVLTPVTENPVLLAVYPPGLPATTVATYLSGPDGSFSSPAEPVLPLVTRNVTVPNTILRGVGFRSGHYVDALNVRPLTGAPATEIRGVSVSFQSDFFYPAQPWSVNYFDALCDPNGNTRLNVFPAQYRSSFPGADVGTRRAFSDMSFRLYYSANRTTYGTAGIDQSTPGLGNAPSIGKVSALITGTTIEFDVQVTDNPAVGIQEVWVTYTDLGSNVPAWQSLNLVQSMADSTLWTGTLVVPSPGDIRFIVQAVNGVGLVSLDTNLGLFYVPRLAPLLPTALRLDPLPPSGSYGETKTFGAVLTSGAAPLPGQNVLFGLGSQRLQGITDRNGHVALPIQILSAPGPVTLQAAFSENASYDASAATAEFTIVPAPTQITLQQISAAPNLNVQATLTDTQGNPLSDKTVFFVLTDSQGTILYTTSGITDYAARENLGAIPLDPSTYIVRAYFGGEIPLAGNVSAPTLTTHLLDSRYEPSTAAASFTYAAQPASVSYTGDPEVGPDGTLHLSALVQAPGDLTLAIVEFNVLDAPGAHTEAAVAADGVSLALMTGLLPGPHPIEIKVIGGSYTGETRFGMACTEPTLTLIGPAALSVECHASFADPGAQAQDCVGAALQVNVSGTVDPNSPGHYVLTYSAVDKGGRRGQQTRSVHVVDTTPPVITLSGPNPMIIQRNSNFVDPGATAADACEGPVQVETVGSVDSATMGSYTISYLASDHSGNIARKTRLVAVVPVSSIFDLNKDGCVDRADLTILLTQIRYSSTDPAYDLNGVGKVDIADARFLVLHFTNPGGGPCLSPH